MTIYAIIKDNKVINLVDAPDTFALEIIYPEHEVIEQTNETGFADIGGDLIAGKFRSLPPFRSWVWDQQTFSWLAPSPVPSNLAENEFSVWDELTESWSVETFIILNEIIEPAADQAPE